MELSVFRSCVEGSGLRPARSTSWSTERGCSSTRPKIRVRGQHNRTAKEKPAPRQTGTGGNKPAPARNRGGWELRLRQRLADGVEDAVGLERLDDEVLRTELDRLEHLGLLAKGRAHDHLRGRVHRHDVLEGGQAVLLGHGDVEGRQVRLQRLVLLDGFSAIAGL